MTEPKRARKGQRQPLSCTNCARRKLRCSKSIPCTSCIDRRQENTCQREIVLVPSTGKQGSNQSSRRKPRSLARQPSSSETPAIESLSCSSNPEEIPPIGDSSSGDIFRREGPNDPALPPKDPSVLSPEPVLPHIRNETVVTLEFLSHGRQNILGIANFNSSGFSGGHELVNRSISRTPVSSTSCPPWQKIISVEHVRLLLVLQQEDLAWMHNVVHMPTFRQELETNLGDNRWSDCWIALLYALICTTIYHADEAILQEIGLVPSVAFVQTLYNCSVQSLHEANFMAIHRMESIQTICVLLQIAHNLDQSDFISVLLSSGIKIAQSLGLHRLGPDPGVLDNFNTRFLIDREVKKRVWWFMIRQDWLQIPFQNTYLIHASQFNTPMPLNCHEDLERMFHDGRILIQDQSTFTQTSYSNVVNYMSIIIWKHQDRMHKVGYPGNSREGVLKLYEEVLWADGELKRQFKELPSFFIDSETDFSRYPGYLKHLQSVHLINMAHKTLTIHRHFQLQSLRDKTFAYTQQSCLAISEKCIRNIETWPSDSTTRTSLKMWTVITHLLTASVNLTFASIFRNENMLLYDGAEMQRLAKVGRELIRTVEDWSSIARRGGKLLDLLFEAEPSLRGTTNAHFNIEEIITKVSEVNTSIEPDLREGFEWFDFDFGQLDQVGWEI